MIVGFNSDDKTFTVKYYDGEVEKYVLPRCITAIDRGQVRETRGREERGERRGDGTET